MNTAYRISRWKNALKSRWLTIGDIRGLKRGQCLEMINLHRNIRDTTEEYNKPNYKYTPKYFFRNERVIYHHISGVNGKIKRHGQKTWRNFTFEIQYAPGSWYPLSANNGTLPMYDRQSGKKLVFCDSARRICIKRKGPLSYTKIPNSTPVGWRGPMILWKSLCRETTPRIYFQKHQ